MFTSPLSDLSATLRATADLSRLRQSLDTAGRELTTGQAADIRAATGGDLTRLFSIDADLDRLAAIETGLSQEDARLATAQSALGKIADVSQELGPRLIAAIGRGDPVTRDTAVDQAGPALSSVFGALNTRVAGRALFAGAALDATALTGADGFLSDLRGILAGSSDAADAQAALDVYFSDPAGFTARVYGGSDEPGPGATLPDGNRTDAPPLATDPALVQVMRALGTLAASDAAGFVGDAAEMDMLLGSAASALQGAGDGITALRARLGIDEQRVADGRDQAQAERSAISRARNDIAGVDQFEAATRFSALEGQLQSLYTVTARLSTLSLTNFLR